MTQPSLIPAPLASALQARRLAVFCGAGISMLPPSSLPSWWEFNQTLLNEAKRLALENLPGLPAAAAERLRSLSLESIPVQGFSDLVVRHFAGKSYFPVIAALDGRRPNANHMTLAEFVRQGIVRHIVSTNFDTLIEQAFRAAHIPIFVLATDADFESASIPCDSCVLYKIHGSVTAGTSLVDTVSQKLRGLSQAVRARLAAITREHHMLFLGYSGADLSFGSDYLALEHAAKDGPGITWQLRPGEAARDRVQRIVTAAGDRGAVVNADLPEFFRTLGVEIQQLPQESSAGAPDGLTPLRKLVSDFFQAPHIGPTTCAAFCMTLLRKAGADATADALLSALAAGPGLRGPVVPLGAAVAMHHIALDLMDSGRLDEAASWIRREIAVYEAICGLLSKAKSALTAEEMLEARRNLGGAWNNLALCALGQKDVSQAETALEKAREYLEDAGDVDFLCTVYLNFDKLAAERQVPPASRLAACRRSLPLATGAGKAQTIAEASWLEAQLLMAIAEYHGADAALERAGSAIKLLGDIAYQTQTDLLRAELASRRGEPDRALSILRGALNDVRARGAQRFVGPLQSCMVKLLGFHLPARADILQALEDMRAADPERDASLREVAAVVESGVLDGPDGLKLDLSSMEEKEAQLRIAISRAELWKQRTEIVEPLLELCGIYYGAPSRLLDLAEAALAAARLVGMRAGEIPALNHLGIARDLLGDLDGAVQAYEEGLSLATPGTRIVATLRLNLGRVQSRMGVKEAEAMLQSARDDFAARGDAADEMRAVRQIAEHLVRADRRADAIAELEQAGARFAQAGHDKPRRACEHYRELLRQGAESFDAPAARPASEPENPDANARPEDLGDESIRALAAGRPEQARRFAHMAMARYEERGNLLGMSRCWNNLSDIARSENHLPDAIDLTRKALAIRIRIGDVDGEILTLSNLSNLSLGANDPVQAAAYARRCIAEATRRPRSRPLALAWYALAFASDQLGQHAAARDAIERFLELCRSLTDPELPGLRNKIEILAREKYPRS